MSEKAIIEATADLPEGHRIVGAYYSQAQAEDFARGMMHDDPDPTLGYYLTDKRGLWEVVQYPKP